MAMKIQENESLNKKMITATKIPLVRREDDDDDDDNDDGVIM